MRDKKIAPVVMKTYDLLRWLLPKLEKFPRSQKYLLADRNETMLLDVLVLLIEANYGAQRQRLLQQANLHQNALSLQFF